MKKLTLIKNTVQKEVKEGVSYTFFFFGWLVPLFRGQLGEAILVFFISLFTLGLGHIYFMFKINERYKNYLLEQGFIIEREVPLSKGLEVLKAVLVLIWLLSSIFFVAIAIVAGSSVKPTTGLLNIQNQVASDMERQFDLALKGQDPIEICVKAGMVVQAHSQANNEAKYLSWKEIEKKACQLAGIRK